MSLFICDNWGRQERALLRDDLQPQQSPVLGKVQRYEFLRVTLLHLGPEFRASALVHASLIGASVCLLTRAPSTWLVHGLYILYNFHI